MKKNIFVEVKVFSFEQGRNKLIDRFKGSPDNVVMSLKYKYISSGWEKLEKAFLDGLN